MSELKKCQAILVIGDDYGDNHATMHCDLIARHKGPHQETWGTWNEKKRCPIQAMVTWKDQRKGKQP